MMPFSHNPEFPSAVYYQVGKGPYSISMSLADGSGCGADGPYCEIFALFKNRGLHVARWLRVAFRERLHDFFDVCRTGDATWVIPGFPDTLHLRFKVSMQPELDFLLTRNISPVLHFILLTRLPGTLHV